MLDRFMGMLADCTTPAAAFNSLVEASYELGFDACSYTDLAMLTGSDLNSARIPPTFGLPEEWGARYAEQSYHRIDPILLNCRMNTTLLTWSEVERAFPMQPLQKTFMGEAREFGLRDGLSFPVGKESHNMAIVAYVTGERRRISRQDMLTAYSIASAFHLVYRELATPRPVVSDCGPALSRRELQCLEWVCRGKSSWVIAELLGLRPKTIDHYLANASRKLGTGSRVAAAVRALQLGLIQP